MLNAELIQTKEERPAARRPEVVYCPICKKVLGEWVVHGEALFIKDPCPRCKNRVEIYKKLDI